MPCLPSVATTCQLVAAATLMFSLRYVAAAAWRCARRLPPLPARCCRRFSRCHDRCRYVHMPCFASAMLLPRRRCRHAAAFPPLIAAAVVIARRCLLLPLMPPPCCHVAAAAAALAAARHVPLMPPSLLMMLSAVCSPCYVIAIYLFSCCRLLPPCPSSAADAPAAYCPAAPCHYTPPWRQRALAPWSAMLPPADAARCPPAVPPAATCHPA